MTKTKGFRSCWLSSLGGGIVIALAGCGGSAALRAADAGDHDALRASLAAEGEVDAGEARAIARRVLERQIETAQGDSGRRGLDALDEGCIDDFASALGRRASTDDALGAHAARLRMDAGQLPALAYADRVEDRDDDWRAAAARSLTTRAGEVKDPDDSQAGRAGWWRRHLMLDPSTEVRRAALRAAINAADAADSAAVLEAARLDPDPETRLLAIQAAGAVGTREAILALKDLWPGADEDTRLAIVEAWVAAMRKDRDLPRPEGPCSYTSPHPGCLARAELSRVSDEGAQMPALVAALELIHDMPPSAAGTPEGNAAGVVERMIDTGSARLRVEAIASAPLSWPHLVEAIVAGKDDHDDRVAVAAYRRMLALSPAEAKEAQEGLRRIAKKGGLAADDAKAALVEARDDDVLPLLAADRAAKSPLSRADLAERYAALGQLSLALPFVADPDARVRARAACAIVAED